MTVKDLEATPVTVGTLFLTADVPAQSCCCCCCCCQHSQVVQKYTTEDTVMLLKAWEQLPWRSVCLRCMYLYFYFMCVGVFLECVCILCVGN